MLIVMMGEKFKFVDLDLLIVYLKLFLPVLGLAPSALQYACVFLFGQSNMTVSSHTVFYCHYNAPFPADVLFPQFYTIHTCNQVIVSVCGVNAVFSSLLSNATYCFLCNCCSLYTLPLIRRKCPQPSENGPIVWYSTEFLENQLHLIFCASYWLYFCNKCTTLLRFP